MWVSVGDGCGDLLTRKAEDRAFMPIIIEDSLRKDMSM